MRGFGHLNITWHKESGTLPHKYESSETSSHGVTTSTLTIPNVTEGDIGKYYCLAWANFKGIRSRSATLHYSGMFVVVRLL